MPGRRSRNRPCTTAVIFLWVAALGRTAGADEYVFHAVPPVAGAAVSVDGRPAGQVDAEGYALINGVSAGTHSVSLRAADGTSWGPVPITFDPVVNALAPFDTSRPASVDVTCDTNVAGASISMQRHHVATTGSDGAAVVTLPFGTSVRLRIAKTGFLPKTVTVTPGRDRSVIVHLDAIDQAAGHARWPFITIVCVLALLIVASATALGIVLWRERERRRRPHRSGRTQPLPNAISFDRYRLTDVVGSGGLATVYRATDAIDGMPLAIKILEQRWVDDPEMVQKFFAEAEALKEIRKVAPESAVVRCFASGREGGRVTGRPFIAMELLEGETLADVIGNKGALPVPVAAAIGAQIGWALSGAHESGVIHRDLSPDNIFVLDENWRGCGGIAPRVVLIDFGIARVEVLSKRTLEISISGKPGYMAPEQTRGHVATPQMDLYALGVILYQMAAGVPPFTAATPDELMRLHANAEPPELPLTINDGYRRLVQFLMMKDPGSRPFSAMMAAGWLECIADGSWENAFEQTIAAGQARGGPNK